MKYIWVPALCSLLMLAAPCSHAADKIGQDAARHLLNRTGFSASAAEIDVFAALSREKAADRLVAAASKQANTTITPRPEWINEAPLPADEARNLTQEERLMRLRTQNQRTTELRAWWLQEMLITPSPLTEKMTLFWHNHFVSSQKKVRFAPTVYAQHALLRQYALGNFRGMLHAVSRDPAMLIYLDGVNSRKEQPNENFAREVMELFTLGEGNYSEQDIKEAARAFTGWSVDRSTGKFLYRRGIHDNGIKTIFGQRGNFDGDDVLDILLARPEAARFVTRKLWKEFVSPEPADAEVLRLANIFHESNYDIAALMRAILVSDAFYAPANRGSLIKSPVELVVGTLKQFELEPTALMPFVATLNLLGQELFAPPNVKGWPGGKAWINSASLLARRQFIARLLNNDDAMDMRMRKSESERMPGDRAARVERRLELGLAGTKIDLAVWMARLRPADDLTAARRILFAVSPIAEADADMDRLEQVRQWLADPAYQLK